MEVKKCWKIELNMYFKDEKDYERAMELSKQWLMREFKKNETILNAFPKGGQIPDRQRDLECYQVGLANVIGQCETEPLTEESKKDLEEKKRRASDVLFRNMI